MGGRVVVVVEVVGEGGEGGLRRILEGEAGMGWGGSLLEEWGG